MYIKSEWKKAHYDKAYTRAYTTEVVQGKHGVKIISHASVVAETVQKILDVTITWKIEAAGKIDADIEVTKDDEFPDLPRFGVRMFLDKKTFKLHDTLEWDHRKAIVTNIRLRATVCIMQM